MLVLIALEKDFDIDKKLSILESIGLGHLFDIIREFFPADLPNKQKVKELRILINCFLAVSELDSIDLDDFIKEHKLSIFDGATAIHMLMYFFKHTGNLFDIINVECQMGEVWKLIDITPSLNKFIKKWKK